MDALRVRVMKRFMVAFAPLALHSLRTQPNARPPAFFVTFVGSSMKHVFGLVGPASFEASFGPQTKAPQLVVALHFPQQSAKLEEFASDKCPPEDDRCFDRNVSPATSKHKCANNMAPDRSMGPNKSIDVGLMRLKLN